MDFNCFLYLVVHRGFFMFNQQNAFTEFLFLFHRLFCMDVCWRVAACLVEDGTGEWM